MDNHLQNGFWQLKKRSIVIAVIGVAWLGVAVAATVRMAGYANSPGQATTPPTVWPDSSGVPRDNKALPTFIMFVHPHCPCSRASIGELALLMASCRGRINAHVVFLRPAETDPDWVRTGTWQEASRIPGVAVHADSSGHEARLFHIETSGDTVLYAATGELLFHGGITSARGHAGDNAGRDALQALLFGQPAAQTTTPAFGCSLFGCRPQDEP